MARKKVERNIAYDDIRNRYYITLEFGCDPETGRQIRKTKTFVKLKDAQRALRKHEVSRDEGKAVIPRELTFAQWLNEWMKTIAIINRAATTVYGYQKMIDNHIAPALGDIPLQKLGPQDLQKYYAMLIQGKGLSSNTAYKHHDLINLILKRAVIQGLLWSSVFVTFLAHISLGLLLQFYLEFPHKERVVRTVSGGKPLTYGYTPGLEQSSNPRKETVPFRSYLCSIARFKWGTVSVIRMRAHMVISDISEFFYLSIKRFFRVESIVVRALIFQGIEISFHRCIVIGVSSFAHALCHMPGFTEFDERL